METPTAEPARANVRRVWVPEEDRILQRGAELQLQNGSLRDWKLIARNLPNRTNKDCRKRWSKICDSANKGPWSRHEDKLLEEAIAQVGPRWKSVAKRVGTRHADQCAKRWRHFLDPDLDHSQWEPEDDGRLWVAVLNYGSNWRKVVEEEFPERSPNNVRNRYAVIKNLRQRGKNSAATPATYDKAESVEASSSMSTSRANDGGQGPTSANSNTFNAFREPLMDFEDADYSTGALDDDFGLFLLDPLTPQTLPSSTISTESLTDAIGLTSGFAPDSHCTALDPAPAMRMEHCSNATTSPAEHLPDCSEEGVAASPTLEHFPQMEPGVTKNIGNEAQPEILWQPPTDCLADGWTQSVMDGLSRHTVRVPTTPFSSDSAQAAGDARRVSLLLEDMQPETASRVTLMLLNSNVDLKMTIVR